MAIVSLTNQAISTWTQGIFNLKQTLKLAGWTVLSSADNATYSSTSDIITSAGSGTGGLARTDAWFRIKSPDGYAEYVFQRGVNDQQFRVVFSGNKLSGGFIGGTPNATTIPTATDGVELKTSGFDLFGTPCASATPRWHVIADNAAPYTWWCGSWKISTGTLSDQTGLIHDVCTALTPGDNCGYIVHYSSSNFTTVTTLNGATNGGESGQTYFTFCRNVTNTAWAQPEAHSFQVASSTGSVFKNSVANALTLKDELLPVIYTISNSDADNTINFNLKGVATMMRWKSINRPITSTYSVNSERDRIIFDSISLPWDGSIPLV